MTGKERVRKAWAGQEIDRNPFWLGEPSKDALEIYLKAFGGTNRLELAQILNEDVYWLACNFAWESPDGRPIFDILGGKEYVCDSQNRVFTNCEDILEVEAYNWPDPSLINLDKIETKLSKLEKTDMAIFGGMWSCFFHDVADFFGMQIYFEKMYTNPDVVHAVTDKVVDFYLKSNRIIFEKYADRFDSFFMGNDFGTQLCTLISPDCFGKFVLPGYKKLVDLGHEFGLKVMVHSCGAISRILPDMIDAGIDGLHPIQALATDMDAEYLVKNFGDKLLYMGGVDTQNLLPFGNAEAVREEVARLKKIFGKKFIVSPSHEALLPNVSPQNVMAMRNAAFNE